LIPIRKRGKSLTKIFLRAGFLLLRILGIVRNLSIIEVFIIRRIISTRKDRRIVFGIIIGKNVVIAAKQDLILRKR